jgi:hypothetical protein
VGTLGFAFDVLQRMRAQICGLCEAATKFPHKFSQDFSLNVFARRPFEKGLVRRMDYKRHFALLTETIAQNYKGSVDGKPPSRRDMLRLHMALRFAKRFKQTW